MTDVATLLGEFLDELNAGNGPEVSLFIEKAESEADRIELAQGIEAVLAFAPDSSRHPRDAASGALVSPIDASQLSAAIDEMLGASGELAEAVPSWREAFGASVADFAKRILSAGGLATTEGNVTTASRWVTEIESGAVRAESLSDRAMRALSSVLGTGPEEAVAFRMMQTDAAVSPSIAPPDELLAEKLEDIAEVLGDAMPEPEGDSDVDAWFSSDD